MVQVQPTEKALPLTSREARRTPSASIAEELFEYSTDFETKVLRRAAREGLIGPCLDRLDHNHPPTFVGGIFDF